MKFMALALIGLALATGAFAAEYTVKGKEATKLFQQLEKAQPTGWEGDCGMGKCWVGGTVKCERKIGTSKKDTPTTCTMTPVSE